MSLLAQPGQRSARRVRQPAGGGDQLAVLEVRGFHLFHSLTLPTLRELVAIGYPFCTTPWVAPKLEKLTWRVGRKEHLETSVRTGDPHSATAQFFINLKDNGFLNHTGKNPQGWGYTVFGKVVEGMDVVDKIAKVKTSRGGISEAVPAEAVIIQKASSRPATE